MTILNQISWEQEQELKSLRKQIVDLRYSNSMIKSQLEEARVLLERAIPDYNKTVNCNEWLAWTTRRDTLLEKMGGGR